MKSKDSTVQGGFISPVNELLCQASAGRRRGKWLTVVAVGVALMLQGCATLTNWISPSSRGPIDPIDQTAMWEPSYWGARAFWSWHTATETMESMLKRLKGSLSPTSQK